MDAELIPSLPHPSLLLSVIYWVTIHPKPSGLNNSNLLCAHDSAVWAGFGVDSLPPLPAVLAGGSSAGPGASEVALLMCLAPLLTWQGEMGVLLFPA